MDFENGRWSEKRQWKIEEEQKQGNNIAKNKSSRKLVSLFKDQSHCGTVWLSSLADVLRIFSSMGVLF